MFWNRKRLIFILILCLILVLVCMAKENEYKDINRQESILVNGTPVSLHTVILDAGHGEPDRTELLLIMEFQRKRLILKLFCIYKNY